MSVQSSGTIRGCVSLALFVLGFGIPSLSPLIHANQALMAPPGIQGSQATTSALASGFQSLGEFPGVNGSAASGIGAAMDPTIAVGPNSVFINTNGPIQIRGKTGAIVAAGQLTSFFDSVRHRASDRSDETLIDATVAFDPRSSRFFLAAAGAGDRDAPCSPLLCVSHIFLTVSKTANPTSLTPADWYFYAIDATFEGGSRVANFPEHARVAFDDRMLVIVHDTLRFGDSENLSNSQHVVVRVLDKATLIRGEPTTAADLVGLQDPISGGRVGQLVPALHFDNAGGFFLVSTSGGVNCGYVVWGIQGSISSPTLSAVTAVPQNPPGTRGCSRAGDAPQPGGAPPLRTAEVLSFEWPIVYRNGSLWATQHFARDFGSGEVSAVRWSQLDVSRWPTSVTFSQDGFFGADRVWSFMPSLAVDSSGNMALVYGRSSTTEYPSLYYRGRLSGDPVNTLRDDQILRAGEASLTVGEAHISYGDYFGAALDPVDGTFWLIGQYVRPGEIWDTWVAHLGVASQGVIPTATSTSTVPTSTQQVSSLTPTALPSPTRSPTVTATGSTAGVLGGKNIGIVPGPNGATIVWDDGTAQNGYVVARYVPDFALLPPGLQSANVTAIQDSAPVNAPVGTLYCYILGPTTGSPPALAGVSNFACELANTHSSAGAPQSLTLRVTQTENAALSWSGPLAGGQDGFRILSLSGQTVSVEASALSRTFALPGFDCFMVFALNGGLAIGNTDAVCGLAGVSTLGP